jgi:ribosomal protein S18 acetylase RimI-like enzyme
LHGYSFFVYEGSKGVIGDLFVAQESIDGTEEHVIENRLVTHVVETLQQSPGVHRIEAQLLVHQSGSVAIPFESQGFRRFPRLFMTLPMKNGTATGNGKNGTPVAPKGFEIRRWTEQDYHTAAALINECYRDHIDSEINDQYRTTQGALRFLNNIVRFPGCGFFDNSASFVAHERGTGNIVGVILCSRVRGDVGHITQVCILPKYRGHHLGWALMEASAHDLKRRNFQMLSLTVTEANHGAVELYKRLGFSISRVFDAFVWEG